MTIAEPPINNWLVTNFGAAGANSPSAADTADPDSDGLANLAEYALRLFPTTPSQPPAANVFTYTDGDRLRIFVPRDAARIDVTVVVESTDDLSSGAWTPLATSTLGRPFTGPGYVGGDSATPGVKTVEVRDIVNIPQTLQRWMRVRVAH